MGLSLTVRGCWWPRRWAPDSPPAARTRCWRHSRCCSLTASSLLWWGEGGRHATVTLRNTPLKTVLISHLQVCNALPSAKCRQVCAMQTTSTTEAFNVSPSNGKHFHRSCDKWEKHHGFTPVDTYWLEVWGTRLWSVVSTWGRQHHCWGGRTSRGSSGRSPTRPWTTSCPHWDVSDKKNNH